MKLDLLTQLGRSSFKLSDIFPLHPNVNNMEFTIPEKINYIECDSQIARLSPQGFAAILKNGKDGLWCTWYRK
jgi:hypothetical protein